MLIKYNGSNGTGMMRNTGDLVSARLSWLNEENPNLDFLLKFRYSWMNSYLSRETVGLEIGSGIGASKAYISKEFDLRISDNNKNSWLDISCLDATEIKMYASNGFDYIIANNVIHHLAYPAKFVSDCFDILPIGGKLIIQEINTSLLCRFILRILRHEPFDETVNVYDSAIAQSKPDDNWDANCSIPKLLFSDHNKFSQQFQDLKITHFKYTEVFTLLLSGGVTAKIWYPKLPTPILKSLLMLDEFLCALAPKFFAFQMQVVIERN